MLPARHMSPLPLPCMQVRATERSFTMHLCRAIVSPMKLQSLLRGACRRQAFAAIKDRHTHQGTTCAARLSSLCSHVAKGFAGGLMASAAALPDAEQAEAAMAEVSASDLPLCNRATGCCRHCRGESAFHFLFDSMFFLFDLSARPRSTSGSSLTLVSTSAMLVIAHLSISTRFL